MKRYFALGTLVLALGACVHATDADGPPIPAGSLVFTFEPTVMSYLYIDSTVSPPFRLDWLVPPENTFNGFNCLGLLPNTPADTAHGTFTFSWSGPNTGPVQRSNTIDSDTVIGYFLPPANETPTRGNYSIDAGGNVTLSWSDGTPTRYFNPVGTIRLSADSIISDAVILTHGDSIREVWHVAWIFSGGNGC